MTRAPSSNGLIYWLNLYNILLEKVCLVKRERDFQAPSPKASMLQASHDNGGSDLLRSFNALLKYPFDLRLDWLCRSDKCPPKCTGFTTKLQDHAPRDSVDHTHSDISNTATLLVAYAQTTYNVDLMADRAKSTARSVLAEIS